MNAGRRRQQVVRELGAASMRALSGISDLHFRGNRVHRDGQLLPTLAPHLQMSDAEDLRSFRGASDGVAMRLSHSSLDLHRSLRPEDPVEAVVFDLLEQFRSESLASATLPGVTQNLRHRHEQWALAAQSDGLTKSAAGLFLYTVAQVARARVTGEPVVEATEGLIEPTRMALSQMIGTELRDLRRHRHHQSAYATPALAIAKAVADSVRRAVETEDERATGELNAATQALGRLIEFEEGGEAPVPEAGVGEGRSVGDGSYSYGVYTTAYDVERRASSLVRPELAQQLRRRLDERIAAQGANVARIARDLMARLAVPKHDGWESAREEGRIDGRRLAQLVAVPTERRLFRTEHLQPTADYVVGFLIDCSGSMRSHIESIALLVDVLARALEQAGIACEILGFTTAAWNGGRARRDWLRAGAPSHPGRLNERCHIVFKDADTTWRRARRDIAALLKEDFFREGVDGEAVEWACARLASRQEERRTLVVVSDGCPMDGATALANGEDYLDQHLRQVVERHERTGSVQVRALGVGLDLSQYYGRSCAIEATMPLNNEVFRDVARLVGSGR